MGGPVDDLFPGRPFRPAMASTATVPVLLLAMLLLLVASPLGGAAPGATAPGAALPGPVRPISPGVAVAGYGAPSATPIGRPSAVGSPDPARTGGGALRPPVPVGPPPSAGPPDLRPRAGPVDPYAIYTGEPAPMGIADYGLAGNGSPYHYATPALRGFANVTNLSVRDGSSSGNFVSFELDGNVVLAGNGSRFVYWAQSVAELNTSSGFIVFFDALWNESGPAASLAPATVSGNGTVATSRIQQDEYTDTAGPGYAGSFAPFPEPGPLGLELRTSNASAGPTVTFGFWVGAGWVPYDTVTFHLPGSPRSDGFVVDGSTYTPATTFYDAEFVLGGPGASGTAAVVTSQMTFALDAWAGHNYAAVASAWNFGSDSLGTVSGIVDTIHLDAALGFVGAFLGSGSGLLGPLYNATSVGWVAVTVGLPDGSLSANGAAAGPFDGSPLLLVAAPGPINVSVALNGFLFGSGTAEVVAGQTVSLDLSTRPLSILQFQSVGLPGGVLWSVSVGTVTDGSTEANLSFPLPVGSYVYAVNPVPGYRVVPGGGPVEAVAPGVNLSLTWTAALYPVFFNETGLPLPTNWTVTVTYLGETYTAFGDQAGVVGMAPAGPFQFSVATGAPYRPDPANGSGTIFDRPQAFSIAFTVENGTVEGTVTPATATVALGEVVLAGTGSGGYRVVLPPGPYPFNFSAPGYTEIFEWIVVEPNRTLYNNVTLLRPAAPRLFTGDLPEIGIVAVAGVLLVAAVVVMNRRRPRSPPPEPELAEIPFYIPPEPAESEPADP